MTLNKITVTDGLPTLQLAPEMLDEIGVAMGDEVEVSVSDRKLIIRAVSEAERAAKMKQIMEELFVQRDSAYRRLAEGVK